MFSCTNLYNLQDWKKTQKPKKKKLEKVFKADIDIHLYATTK